MSARRRTAAMLAALAALAGGCKGHAIEPRPVVSLATIPFELRPGQATKYRVDLTRSRVEIFGSSLFTGEQRIWFERWDARVDLGPLPRITAEIDMTSLDSSFPGAKSFLMSHMLEARRYPRSTIVATMRKTTGPEDEYLVEARASLHGVTRDLRFTGRLAEEGSGYRFRASFTVSRQLFGVRYPALEAFIRDDVRVLMSVRAAPWAGEEPVGD